MAPKLITLGLCLITLCSATAGKAEPYYFRVLSGPADSTSFDLASRLSGLISNPPGSPPCELGGNCGVEGLIAIVQNSKNSLDSLKAMEKGLAEAVLISSDFLLPPKKPDAVPSFLALASLDRVAVHVIVSNSSRYRYMSDLRGRKIAVGAADSDNMIAAKLFLAKSKLPGKKGRTITQPIAQSIDHLQAGKIDAMVIVERIGYPPIENLLKTSNTRLLRLDEKTEKALLDPDHFGRVTSIPVEAYGLDQRVTLWAYPILWFVHRDLPDALAAQLTEILFRNRDKFPNLDAHLPDRMIHPGARSYFLNPAKAQP